MNHENIPCRASSVHFTTANFHPFRTLPVRMQSIKNSITQSSWENKIPEDIIKCLYWWFKRTENFQITGLVVLSIKLHDEMHWRFPIACNRDYNAFRTLTLVPLCRFHFSSDRNKISSAFEPSTGELRNIFGNDFYIMDIMLYKFHSFELKPEVCETDRNFRLQNELNLLCRIYPCCSCPKRRMLWSQIDALHLFSKSVIRFSEKATFEKFVKILSPQKFQFFSVFFFFFFFFFSIWCTRLLKSMQWTCWKFV